MTTQEVNLPDPEGGFELEDVDLGTSASGFYAYITPMLFYNIGDKMIHDGKVHSLKLGIGIGYLKVKGDMIFTEKNPSERHVFDIRDYGSAVGVMLDYRYDRFFARVTGAGPFIDEGAFEYQLFDISMDMGVRIDL